MIRLFVGLELPESVKTSLCLMTGGIRGARWQTREQMHLTLKFIGEVEEPCARDIADALYRLNVAGFDLMIKGAGYFGKARMTRALWAGIEASAALRALHERIEHVLQECGIAPETRRFRPHVTLARLRGARPGDIQTFAATYAEMAQAPFRVDHFSLFRSDLGREGAHYTIVDRFPFSNAQPVENSADLPHIPAAE